MKHTILFAFLAVTILGCAHTSRGRSCAPPEAFDIHAAYLRTVFVSPDGNDESGTGTSTSPFRTPERAVRNVVPGTDIVLRTGNYPPGAYIANLQGTAENPIRIRGESPEKPAIISGGNGGMQLSDPRYLVLENLRIEGSSSNGLNIDDGGSYSTPAEFVILRNITVRNIEATGNVDGIKLSGLDRFRIEQCTVDNPGDGGSAIDMVGCHDGILLHNRIVNCQSSGIQAKGGCSRLLIYANRFENAGMRPINMGGSTGMQYFRPLDASAEASHLTAWGNIFIGGDTPIAFVGCENGLFAHNTVYLPGKWAARILQENNNAQLIQCRNNAYANNIIVVDNRVGTFINIGPNTQSNTFLFANNLWFHSANNSFSGPNLPSPEIGSLIQKNPLFVNPGEMDFHLQNSSPAIGSGRDLQNFVNTFDIQIPTVGDYEERCWNTPPSIGALEGDPLTGIRGWKRHP